MNALTPFQFEGAEVRLIDRNGEPWFVLADVCRVLEIGNPSDAASRLDEDEKMTLDNTEGHAGQRGGAQSYTIINESGLYSLVLTSRKPAAKRFKKWVTAEVLPTLRRTGVYLMGPDAEDLPSLADGKLWGTRVSKVNAAARMLSAANTLYGPEAARALWAMEPGLPKISHFQPGILAGTAQDDPVGCFRHLMRQAAAPGRTVSKVLHLALSDKLAERMLPDLGLRLGAKQGPDTLAVANAHPFLADCYAETQWIGEWRIALAQIPGATASASAITFGKVQSRAVLIPRREVIELLHGGRSALM
ncbi:MAG: Bro-N domain-containing protein [Pseudomonadota bacterium]